MHIKISKNATATPCSFPIAAEIQGYNETRTDFTLTILPALTSEQQWHNSMQSIADFVSPLNSIWTFITPIAAVMIPIVVRKFSKKQEKDKEKDDEKMSDDASS